MPTKTWVCVWNKTSALPQLLQSISQPLPHFACLKSVWSESETQRWKHNSSYASQWRNIRVKHLKKKKTSASQFTSLYAVSEPQEAQTGTWTLRLRPFISQPVLSADSKAFTSAALSCLLRPALSRDFNSSVTAKNLHWAQQQQPAPLQHGGSVQPCAGMAPCPGPHQQLLGTCGT